MKHINKLTGQEVKVTFCYKNNPHYEDVRKAGHKCKLVGNKLYVLPNVIYISIVEGVIVVM